MRQPLWRTFSDGWKYMKLWPNHAVVGAMPEARVIPATRLGTIWLPIAALLNFTVQWYWLGSAHMPQIIAASLFLLLLPLQGYYWLGRRSYQELTPALKAWYFDLRDKLSSNGEDVRLPSDRKGPCYIDLARILRKALAVLPPDEH